MSTKSKLNRNIDGQLKLAKRSAIDCSNLYNSLAYNDTLHRYASLIFKLFRVKSLILLKTFHDDAIRFEKVKSNQDIQRW